MKHYYFFILLVCFGVSNAQIQNKVDFSKLDRKGMKTSLLLTDVKMFSVLAQENDTYGMYEFSQSYEELGNSDVLNRFPNHDLLKSEMHIETTDEIIKIGLIHTDFEIISKSAYDKGWLTIKNNVVTRHSKNYVFDSFSNTLISPLTQRKKGLHSSFLLDSRFFVNTTTNPIFSIKADFDDGKGMKIISVDQIVAIDYPTEGKKQLVFEITFENGDKKIRKSNLDVSYSNVDLRSLFGRNPTLITATRTPDLALYGETDLSPGKCEYEIFLSPDGVLDKPIFVIDGFDPSDTRSVTGIYNLLNYTDTNGTTRNLGDRIRTEEGYDIVIVNFPTYTNAANKTIDGGADYIERNALSLVSVIELINSQKVGSEKDVIIGPSMGGLVSRYALRYMEQNNIDPQARLWLSFDSPHYGANVPIGLQHLFNYFAYGYGNSDAVKPLVQGMLRSPAAKQMLVDHFDAHTTSIVGVSNPVVPTTGLPLTPAGCPNFRTNFQNRMNALGFPQSTRNISMTNGSGVGAKYNAKDGTPINPGFDLIGTASNPTNIDTGAVIAIINTRAQTFCEFMPNANVQETIVNVKIQAQIFFWITQDTFLATAKQGGSSNGVDSSPAGLFDMGGLAASLGTGNTVLTNFLSAMKADYFSFIPVVSAMGLNVGGTVTNNQPNYYFNINLGAKDTPWDGIVTPTSNTTPFVNWYMPPTNEAHVTLTSGNVDFAWCEIVQPNYDFTLTSTNSVSVCSNANPTFTFNYNNIHGCPPTTTFTCTGVPQGAIASFTPNSINSNGSVNLNLSNVSPGTYTIMVIPDNNINKAIPVTVTVYPPNPSLTNTTQYSLDNGINFSQASSVTIAPGSNLEITIPSSLYAGTIQWFDPTGAPRGNTNPILTGIIDNSSDEGIWHAVITYSNNCDNPVTIPFEVIVDAALAVNSNEFNQLSVFPNPTSGMVNINSNSNLMEAKTTIVDLRGRILNPKNTHINATHIQIDVSDLAQGVYFLIIENDKNKSMRQIIKN